MILNMQFLISLINNAIGLLFYIILIVYFVHKHQFIEINMSLKNRAEMIY
ncbi:hypothetical protein Solca_2326 [Solitalea canadensis DSM 3403]|uniref:Uncharacterized protein n=1 Tax=Solitalea canadensis (strain ATCC 29591 / DSM 3403 / JCM 21819 / LMG 8368 / NBRC 15130 / NCIMB 12057 / USAM 9D) TaxID=929556 RepID=H8KRA1_SOLCM|nr:hypothetical protein Solca_2326 [Solitalea canadensis DSM 3403]